MLECRIWCYTVCQATVDTVGPTIIPAGECFEVSKAAAEDRRLAAMENQ